MPFARYLEAEVGCLHCGHAAGLLRRHEGPRTPLFFHRAGAPAAVAIKHLTAVRCAHCGGPVCAETFEVRSVFTGQLDPIERPRRGRPPKWLIEARRAQEEEELAELARLEKLA